jgi:hypothetical protein
MILAPPLIAPFAQAVGITAGGLGMIGLTKKVSDYIRQNPEKSKEIIKLISPGAAGIEFAMNMKLPGVFAPDAEEMEKERQRIEQNLKPRVTKPIDQGPIKTGETIPPKIETTETLPATEEVGPIKEQFPDLFDELNKAVITYSKNVPKNFEDLAKRSVGKDKGTKAAEALFDDDIFTDVLDESQLKNIRQLEDRYVGDILDRGDPSIPLAFTNSMVQQYEEYFEDYKEKLAEIAKEKLGDEFLMFRLMKKEDALKMLINQELPTIKKLDEDTDEVIPFTINMMGKDVEMLQENMSFTLNPRTALGFKEIFDSEGPDENFVLVEFRASPSDIVMRGHSGETDLVLNMGEAINAPQLFKLYDFKYKKEDGKIKGLDVSENKEFKNFFKKPEEPIKKTMGGLIDKPLTGNSRYI